MLRGAKRITAAPIRHVADPIMSQRLGRMPSTAHSHANDAMM
jgi:hypothetical protein